MEQQKNNREFEVIVQSCIMNTIRDNIPIDQLLRQYIDETQEIDIEKTEKIIEKKEIVEPKEESPDIDVSSAVKVEEKTPEVASVPSLEENAHITFSETNKALDMGTNEVIEEEMKDEPSLPLDPVEDESFGDPLQIGESISLSFDDQLEPKKEQAPEPESLSDVIDLGIETLDEPLPKTDIIDLGATELEL